MGDWAARLEPHNWICMILLLWESPEFLPHAVRWTWESLSITPRAGLCWRRIVDGKELERGLAGFVCLPQTGISRRKHWVELGMRQGKLIDLHGR